MRRIKNLSNIATIFSITTLAIFVSSSEEIEDQTIKNAVLGNASSIDLVTSSDNKSREIKFDLKVEEEQEFQTHGDADNFDEYEYNDHDYEYEDSPSIGSIDSHKLGTIVSGIDWRNEYSLGAHNDQEEIQLLLQNQISAALKMHLPDLQHQHVQDEEDDKEEYEEDDDQLIDSQGNHIILKGQSSQHPRINLPRVLKKDVENTMNFLHAWHGRKQKKSGKNKNKLKNHWHKKNSSNNKKQGKNNKKKNNNKKGKQSFKRNVCLKRSDPYRTCFQCAADPYSGVEYDTVDRKRYDYGARLYKQGYQFYNPQSKSKGYPSYSKGSDPSLYPLEPYTPPYVASDEKVMTTVMDLSLLMDSTRVNCNNMVAIEEVLLNYLADNIGSEDTFQPVCAYTLDSARSKQNVPDGNGKIAEATALAFELMFVLKRGAAQRQNRDFRVLESGHDRQLRNRCSPKNKATCCSQGAANGDIGAFCSSVGCSISRCGQGRRYSNRHLLRKLEVENENRDLQVTGRGSSFGFYKNKNFNTVVKGFTAFQPVETRAILGTSDINAVAICSANCYSIDD